MNRQEFLNSVEWQEWENVKAYLSQADALELNIAFESGTYAGWSTALYIAKNSSSLEPEFVKSILPKLDSENLNAISPDSHCKGTTVLFFLMKEIFNDKDYHEEKLSLIHEIIKDPRIEINNLKATCNYRDKDPELLSKFQMAADDEFSFLFFLDMYYRHTSNQALPEIFITLAAKKCFSSYDNLDSLLFHSIPCCEEYNTEGWKIDETRLQWELFGRTIKALDIDIMSDEIELDRYLIFAITQDYKYWEKFGFPSTDCIIKRFDDGQIFQNDKDAIKFIACPEEILHLIVSKLPNANRLLRAISDNYNYYSILWTTLARIHSIEQFGLVEAILNKHDFVVAPLPALEHWDKKILDMAWQKAKEFNRFDIYLAIISGMQAVPKNGLSQHLIGNSQAILEFSSHFSFRFHLDESFIGGMLIHSLSHTCEKLENDYKVHVKKLFAMTFESLKAFNNSMSRVLATNESKALKNQLIANFGFELLHMCINHLEKMVTSLNMAGLLYWNKGLIKLILSESNVIALVLNSRYKEKIVNGLVNVCELMTAELLGQNQTNDKNVSLKFLALTFLIPEFSKIENILSLRRSLIATIYNLNPTQTEQITAIITCETLNSMLDALKILESTLSTDNNATSSYSEAKRLRLTL